jgi:aspartate-semialdehyde dehydrogenase
VIAHPAAIALALFLRRLHEHDPIRRSVVEIFAPASEHDARGVQELHQQTLSLFSFQKLPRAVFDAQLSFNLLPRYGEEAPASLEDTELRIERHLATCWRCPGKAAARRSLRCG